MSSNDATFAIYRDREEVKLAIHSLKKLGFDESAIWTFQSQRSGRKDFSQILKYQSKSGARIGAFIGAILGGFLSLFTLNELIDNRFIMLTVGTFAGGLLGAAAGALVGIGTPDPAAKRYGQYLQSGGILLSVHSEDPKKIHRAYEVLAATGGQDIQLIDEFKTWKRANLERVDLEKLQSLGSPDLKELY